MEANVGIIGEGSVVLPFKLLNFATFSVTSAEEARRQIDALAADHYGVIYITENIAEQIPDVLDHYEEETLPALIVIPSGAGHSDFAEQRLRETVERAVGQDILN